MARYEWDVSINEGKPFTTLGGQLHVALNRAFTGHPLPPMGEIIVIKIWRARAVPPRKRR